MRIAILTGGTRGDVQPYVGLGVGLQRAGYQVCVPAPECFRSLVTEAGLEFVPSSALDPQELLRLPETQELRRKILRPATVASTIRPILRVGQRYFASLLDAYWSSSENADVLVSSIWYFGLDCAEKRGIPHIYAPHQAVVTPTRAFPSSLMSPFGVRLDSAVNRLTYYLMYLAFWPMYRTSLNNWRRRMGLSPHSASSYWRWSQAQTTVCGFSPSVLPMPTDWPPHHHVTGYWFLDEPTNWQPPAGLVRFLESDPPPICVGFGSMVENDPTRMTRVVVEALQLSGQRAVLLSGWGGQGALSLPATIYRLDAIPHSWLFPRTTIVVHHGGMGTTAAALRAGVPSVIVPFFFDQPFWARRVEQLGAGVRCVSSTKVTAKELAAALDKATTDTILRQRAATLGEKIRAEDGVGQAVAVIRDCIGQ
jgi:UDP:flavonoid glycosyltransferase YjiC (YdhE family)